MTKRWPKTSLWQRFERTFRTIHGSRWRAAAATKFGVKRSELRGFIDRNEHPDVEQIDKILIDHLHQHVADLRQRAADVDNVARDVMRAQNEVGENYLIEVPIELSLLGPDDWRTSEPTTPWEHLVQTTFADILEDA